jgi:hypothetical protein
VAPQQQSQVKPAKNEFNFGDNSGSSGGCASVAPFVLSPPRIRTAI